ncbi:MAG TPA: hypothetical protein VEC57_13460 [Candidatus Limnocylindrales bacterium]|nr:hypothetical protein [Candidatus Limnocylindrales bacterium]
MKLIFARRLVCAAMVVSCMLTAPVQAQQAQLGHGARSKAADGTTVIYDKVRGVHVVPDQQNTFYSGDRFYRHIEGIWMTAAASKGPWDLASPVDVPLSLRDAYLPPKKKVTAKLPNGIEAVYQPELKVFAVPTQAGVYIHDGRYYRYADGVWLTSVKIEGPWELAATKKLPGPLKHRVKPPAAGTKVTLPSGTVVEYDADLLMFRVVGQNEVFLSDGMFITRRDGKWMSASAPDGNYLEMHAQRVPAALKAHYKKTEPRPAAAKKPPAKKPTTKEEREALRVERDRIRAERDKLRAEREAQRRASRSQATAKVRGAGGAEKKPKHGPGAAAAAKADRKADAAAAKAERKAGAAAAKADKADAAAAKAGKDKAAAAAAAGQAPAADAPAPAVTPPPATPPPAAAPASGAQEKPAQP